jgi:TolB-like protein/Tfp pilus assembly protein PilF
VSGFFDELKRRKVYRVAVAYVIAAGGIIQLASAVFPAWELPNWALRLTVVLLLIGFPLALVLAWAFDVTPQGIRATPVAGAGTETSHRRRNVLLLVGLGLLVSAVAGFFLLPRANATRMEKSIAVLPFANLSDDKENAYFADGIQDDILTSLAKIGDLKVISRTSVMAYRGKPASVRDIGKTLGASAILEGSVRREGDRVRVNVQLINAQTDEHIWAEDYDRKLTDVFAIQSDLAREIAEKLHASLSPSDMERMTKRPTENGEAYLAYVQARNLFEPEDYEKIKQGEQLYQRALDLDPGFALAMADFSRLQSFIYHVYDSVPARRERARTLAERALQLQPNLPEGHLALGFCHYYGENDFEAAEKEFTLAQKGLPNESEVYLALGAIQRRQGRWTESTANLQKAAELNPKASWALQNLAFNYEMLRDFDAANETVARALKVDPHNLDLWGIKAKIAVEEKGDFSAANYAVGEMEKTPPSEVKTVTIITVKLGLLLLQRKFDEALHLIENAPDDLLPNKPGMLVGKYVTLALIRQTLKDENGARSAALRAKALIEKRLQEDPNSSDAHIHLAYALACLGDKSGAAAEAERAMQALPESKDAFNGPDITIEAAKVYAAIGNSDRAIEMITGLLQRPAALTVALLRLDSAWDSLRKDPRFQQLVAEKT